MTAAQAVVWTVQVGDELTSARWEPAEGAPAGCTLVLAHGASTHREHPRMHDLAATFLARGLSVVRPNFLYTEKQKGPPDRMPRLMECYAAVVEHVRRVAAPGCLLLGGHSMGGRVASMLAADGLPSDGVVLLGYPLHPAGQPEKRRDEHLARIAVPVLCLNGTRDELCQTDVMARVLAGLPPTFRMHWLAEADHGFRVLKRSGRTEAEVLQEIGDAVEQWAHGVAGHGSPPARTTALPGDGEGGTGPK